MEFFTVMPRRFLSSRLALGIATFALVSAAPTIGAAGEMSDPATFFGTISEIEGARVDELRSRLIAISEQCTKLELVFGVNIIDAPDSSGEGSSGQSDDRLIRPYIAGLFKF
jgi:hypothetical protein